MGSINWVGSALGLLSLPSSGDTAPAREHAGAMDRISVASEARYPFFQDRVRAMTSGDDQLRRTSRSSMLDWGTGGFELRGERLKSGSRPVDTVRLTTRWQRTYAVDVSFRESGFETGARLERTNRRVAGGPLLINSTKSVAQMVYAGAQISHAASIRLIGFDSGGWSESATGAIVSRIVSGEPAARKGAAIEIGRFGFQPENARRDPQLKLRVERGRTGTRSATSATISWKVRL
jgi:hypothetical protein